ncbi:MAG: DUF357 domain-containing protein [Methanomicrobiales archaeon]
MEINAFHKSLSDILDNSDILAPPESLLGLTGSEILGMAQCYLADGSCFLSKDDPVNTVASFAYAAGWLDTGAYIGIFAPGSLCRMLLSGGDYISERFHDQLIEKACRYQRILESAVISSEPGSEAGIQWYEAGEQVITISTAYSTGGRYLLRMNRFEDSLACFSYGHGWLDASIRAGLIRITGNRDLFAI